MPAPLALIAALILSGAPSPGQARDEPAASPPVDTFRPDPAWKSLGNALWFDPVGKKLVVRARVAARRWAA